MDYIDAKHILSPRQKNIGFNGADYNVNLYRGCNHGCIYCDSRSSCYQIIDFDRVRAKRNADQLLDRELAGKQSKGIISFGAMSDPYNPWEAKTQLTRRCLEVIQRRQFGISLLTKSDLVLRDLDIFQAINQQAACAVRMTITTFDDDLCRLIEPHVSVSSKRFETLAAFADRGIITGIHLWPILAYINDSEDNIIQIVRRAAQLGIHYIYPFFGVTLRMNQREYFFDKLDQHFPGMKDKYIQTFGTAYECPVPNAERLYKIFHAECERLGIVHYQEHIIPMIRNSSKLQQVSFFD